MSNATIVFDIATYDCNVAVNVKFVVIGIAVGERVDCTIVKLAAAPGRGAATMQNSDNATKAVVL